MPITARCTALQIDSQGPWHSHQFCRPPFVPFVIKPHRPYLNLSRHQLLHLFLKPLLPTLLSSTICEFLALFHLLQTHFAGFNTSGPVKNCLLVTEFCQVSDARDGYPTSSDIAARPMPALGRAVNSPIRRLMVCFPASLFKQQELTLHPQCVDGLAAHLLYSPVCTYYLSPVR